jgi:NAD(P)-dependent dehydrogenase (short-subunit alcohol dehydrogenase family)
MNIENRVAIITGATGGLGRVVAKIFADQGARLILVGAHDEKLHQLVGELDLAEDHVLGLVANLSEPAAVQQVTENALAKFGRIDILLHFVGGWSGGKPVVDVDQEQVEHMLQQHLWTAFHLAQSILPVMTGNRWGHILVVSSPVASSPEVNLAPYAIGKAAQETLILIIAQEVKGSGITANMVLVKTIDIKHAREQQPKEKNASWATPEEIAATLLHLSAPESSMINGARIPLYGGS